MAEVDKSISSYQENIARLKEVKAEYEKQLENIIPDHYPVGELYYYSAYGNVNCGSFVKAFSGNVAALERYEVYKTEEIRKLADEKTLFVRKLLYFKELFDAEYVPDWKNITDKYYICYDYDDNQYYTCCLYACGSKSEVYFSTKAIAQKCADWLNEEVSE